MSLPNSGRARDIAYHVHQQTNLAALIEGGPTLMTQGEGVYVRDDEGRRYLEAMSGMWSCSLGFSERRLADVAHRQMLEMPYYHTMQGRGNIPSVDLAERLIKMAPTSRLNKVMFHCSGSEVNDAAIKLVWYYHNAIGKPEKKKIIGRVRAYHGNTIATISVSGQPHLYTDFDLPLPMMKHTSNPNYYRFHHDGETEEAFAQRMADDLEALIAAEGPETIGAFFAEPVQGAGGVIVPPVTYFEKIQAILKRHDILFLADEVICGFGRTGNVWGSQTYDLDPDFLSCGKALSASYMPISALMISDKVFDVMVAQSRKLGNFGHGYTHGGHPVACAVALETLKIYEERDIVGHVRTMSPHLLNALKATLDHPLVGHVRGVGLLGGVELVRDKATREAFDPALMVGERVVQHCRELGLLIRSMGDAVLFCPPLIVNEEEIDEIGTKFRQGLDLAWRDIESL